MLMKTELPSTPPPKNAKLRLRAFSRDLVCSAHPVPNIAFGGKGVHIMSGGNKSCLQLDPLRLNAKRRVWESNTKQT